MDNVDPVGGIIGIAGLILAVAAFVIQSISMRTRVIIAGPDLPDPPAAFRHAPRLELAIPVPRHRDRDRPLHGRHRFGRAAITRIAAAGAGRIVTTSRARRASCPTELSRSNATTG